MIGSWSLSPAGILLGLIQLVLILFVLYFLAVAIYWFNRTGKIPSLIFIWRNMVQLGKWAPRIAVHRVRTTPARLRRQKVDAYPALSISKSKKKKTVKRKK